MQQRVAILVRPSSTFATLITSEYVRKIAEMFETNGIQVIELADVAATPPALLDAIMRAKMSCDHPLICYFGHGLDDTWVGDEKVPSIPLLEGTQRLLHKGFNENWLDGSIVYTVACYTVNKLGPSAVKHGAISYFGSRHPMYVGFEETDHNYFLDFYEVYQMIPQALMEGLTCKQAYDMYMMKCAGFIRKYRNNPNWPNEDFYEMAMIKNKQGYSLLGNEAARWQ